MICVFNDSLPYLIINHFFESLAANSHEKAIGIILSDSAIAASAGSTAIKNAGGKVMSGHNALSVIELLNEQFARSLSINVQDFFRNPEAFRFIAAKILPGLIENHPPDQELKLCEFYQLQKRTHAHASCFAEEKP